MGKINYANSLLEEERDSLRNPLHVISHTHPLKNISPAFWAKQDKYLRQTDPQTVEPLYIECQVHGKTVRFALELVAVFKGQPLCGGPAIGYKVMIGNRQRVLWRTDKEWFTDAKDNKREKDGLNEPPKPTVYG